MLKSPNQVKTIFKIVALCVAFILIGFVGTSQADRAELVASNPKVEVFVTSWCPYCQKLENYLKSKRIRFTRYDIDKDARAKAMHEQLGGGGVPVTRIGDAIVRGFDIDAIEAALDKNKSRPLPLERT